MSQLLTGTVEHGVLGRVMEAHRVFFFLDYDGTLTSLAPTPEAAVPLRDTAMLLQQLATMPGTYVALVTGRTIANLRNLLNVPHVYYVGVHGVEVSCSARVVEIASEAEAVRAMIPAIKQQLEASLGARLGILIEDKGMALACHYRLAADDDAAAARAAVEAIAASYQRDGLPIATKHGHAVVELLPTGVTKGKACRALLSMHAPSALAIYIGDDATDEDAFTALPSDAITIRVAAAAMPTAARYRVTDPLAVHEFLGQVLNYRRGLHGAHDQGNRCLQ